MDRLRDFFDATDPWIRAAGLCTWRSESEGVPSVDVVTPSAPTRFDLLVCGIPQNQRRRRRIVFFKAFFDDTGTHADAETTRIAGYVSSVERWDKLTKEWQPLIESWGLEWFHMTDAEGRQDKKYRWTDPQRDERIGALSAMIGQHADCGMVSAIPQQLFNEEILELANSHPAWRGEVKHAYQVCFMKLLGWLLALCRAGLCEPQDIEVVFADQGRIGRQARDLVREALMEEGFPEPVFKCMRGFPPLQAADMLAWRMNRTETRPLEPVPLRHKGILDRVFESRVSEAEIKEFSGRMRRFLEDAGREDAEGENA